MIILDRYKNKIWLEWLELQKHLKIINKSQTKFFKIKIFKMKIKDKVI